MQDELDNHLEALRTEERQLRAELEKRKNLSEQLQRWFDQALCPDQSSEGASAEGASSSGTEKTEAALKLEWAQAQPEYQVELRALRDKFKHMSEKELKMFAFLNMMETKKRQKSSKSPIRM